MMFYFPVCVWVFDNDICLSRLFMSKKVKGNCFNEVRLSSTLTLKSPLHLLLLIQTHKKVENFFEKLSFASSLQRTSFDGFLLQDTFSRNISNEGKVIWKFIRIA